MEFSPETSLCCVSPSHEVIAFIHERWDVLIYHIIIFSAITYWCALRKICSAAIWSNHFYRTELASNQLVCFRLNYFLQYTSFARFIICVWYLFQFSIFNNIEEKMSQTDVSVYKLMQRYLYLFQMCNLRAKIS